jgi:hypothetical protein
MLNGSNGNAPERPKEKLLFIAIAVTVDPGPMTYIPMTTVTMLSYFTGIASCTAFCWKRCRKHFLLASRVSPLSSERRKSVLSLDPFNAIDVSLRESMLGVLIGRVIARPSKGHHLSSIGYSCHIRRRFGGSFVCSICSVVGALLKLDQVKEWRC